MIEIPEAVSLSRQITGRLEGKTIQTVVAGHTPHKLAWFYGDPAGFSDRAVGRTISGATAVGGMLEVHVGDARILFSEGASLRLHSPDAEPPKKHQLLVTFADGSGLSAAVQMYGGMGIFRDGECENEYYLGSRAKPSVLTAQFDAGYFAGILDQPGAEKLSAKAFLATEQRIPGLGNGVLQDILFAAGIHPKSKIAGLDEGRRDRLFRAVKEQIQQMTDGGGRDTEMDLDGNPGGYRTIMSRKTVGTPCPSCGQTIAKAAYMGGSVYYCPVCQPL
jgi:formamidopyrimidine-DNA glycosylase